MKDHIKEIAKYTSPHGKSSLEGHRSKADRLTEAQHYAQTRGLDNLENGKTTLSEVQMQRVLRVIKGGEKITPEGTIQLTASPIEGGMSGEGSSTDSDASDFAQKIRTNDVRNASANIKREYAAHMSDINKSEFKTVSEDMISNFEFNKFKYCKTILQLRNSNNPMLQHFAIEIMRISHERIENQNQRRNAQ